MTFQFLCPQGHLLQGEEWQAGQQSICPICQSVFLIPSPVGGVASGGQMPPGGGIIPPSGGMGQGPVWGGAPPSEPPPGGPAPFPMGQAPQVQPPFSAGGPSGASWPGWQAPQIPTAAGSWSSPLPEPPAAEMPGLAPETAPVPAPETPPVHVVCPSGHELETPRQMLGQEAICPFCGVQFRLRWEATVEYRREKELEEERRLARQSKLWLQWSIAAAVVVVIGLIILIAISSR